MTGSGLQAKYILGRKSIVSPASCHSLPHTRHFAPASPFNLDPRAADKPQPRLHDAWKVVEGFGVYCTATMAEAFFQCTASSVHEIVQFQITIRLALGSR